MTGLARGLAISDRGTSDDVQSMQESGLPEDDRFQIRAVTRALDVLVAINEFANPTVTEIARAVSLPYSTAYRLIQTLVQAGYVSQANGIRRYSPASSCFLLSRGFSPTEHWGRLAMPLLAEWTRCHHWPVAFLVRSGTLMTIKASTDKMTSQTFVDYAQGDCFAADQTASGHAYMAFCDPVERSEMLATLGLGDQDWFHAELDFVRKRGYASRMRVLCNQTPGKTSALSVPVVVNGAAIGVVTMTYFDRAMNVDKAVSSFFESLEKLATSIAKVAEF